MSRLVVSLHDVAPVTLAASSCILRELAQLGVQKTSLLIIPDFHGRAPIQEASAFRGWLSQQAEAGHEPVLHGYYHARPAKKRENVMSRFITSVYTAGEGEFYDLEYEEAARRLAWGRAALDFLGRPITGFIAPAWLLGQAARKAVVDSGFHYTTSINAVEFFGGPGQCNARSRVWSTRTRIRQLASLTWNRGLSRLQRSASLVRIGIHPPDYEVSEIWGQIRQLVQEALRERQAMTYEEFVRQQEGGDR
jgi:uncharacterized protein